MSALDEAIEAVKRRIGAPAEVGEWLEVTQARIDQFANATGDFQWIHTDPKRASESPYGSTIAHGFLTLSLLPYLTGSVRDGEGTLPGAKRMINYGLNKVRFPHPVRCGARIRAQSELVSVAEVAGNGLELVKRMTVEIDGAPKPACVAEMIARAYF